MKQYVITDEDIKRLHMMLAQDPARPANPISEQERRAHENAHRFYNYHVCTWLEEIKK